MNSSDNPLIKDWALNLIKDVNRIDCYVITMFNNKFWQVHAMKIFNLIGLAATFSFAQDNIEEVIVTSSILGKTFNEIGDPIHIVDGSEVSSDNTK